MPLPYVVRYLGLEQAGFIDKRTGFTGTPQTEALVQLLIDATSNIQQPLGQNTLFQWQVALFPNKPQLQTLHTPILKEPAIRPPRALPGGRLTNRDAQVIV